MLKIKETKVRELIARTGLSVRAWGIEHGFPQSTLSNWLNGTRHIKRCQLLKLTDELHVSDASEIAEIVFVLDPEKIAKTAEKEQELICLWRLLTDDQQAQILALIRSIAEPIKKA